MKKIIGDIEIGVKIGKADIIYERDMEHVENYIWDAIISALEKTPLIVDEREIDANAQSLTVRVPPGFEEWEKSN